MTDHEKQVIFEMASINKLPFIRQKCIEELSELIRAISRGDVENILEETCDAEIMILQLLWSLPEGSRTRRAEIFSEKIEYIEGLIAAHKIEGVMFIEKNRPPLFVWFYCVLGMILGILAAAYL